MGKARASWLGAAAAGLIFASCSDGPSGRGPADVASEAGLADSVATGSAADSTAAGDGAQGSDAIPSDSAALPIADGVTEVGGTAYMFGYEPGPVAGAVIAMAELPKLATTTGADGKWRLEVPRGVPLTPCVQHPDYAPMCLQTFVFVDTAPDNLNLQMVPPFYFNAFAALLGRARDKPVCQLVTTVNTKDVFHLDRKQFYAYGAHGVADVTVELDPPAAAAVYFSAVTIPNKELTATTSDGGVVWPNLPPGIYKVRAKHATKKFEAFTVTCEAGRFVNACPPWGAREL